MSNIIEETVFITHDTYISSDNPNQNENKFPLLNVGRAENESKNRALLKADFGAFEGKIIQEAELCLYQMYNGIHASENDVFYLHKVNKAWIESTATWNTVGSSSTGELAATFLLPTTKDIKFCFSIDPRVFSGDLQDGFILKGEEDLDKHDRWFRSSEYTSDSKEVYGDSSSDVYHPHFNFKSTIDPNYVENGYLTRPSDNAGTPIGLIIGLTTGCLALVLIILVAFLMIRKRQYYNEESSVESSVVQKDFVDNLGEVFGVVSSNSEEDESMYTKDNTTIQSDMFTTDEGIEVSESRKYTMGDKVQSMLFGIPEDETTVTSDETRRYTIGMRVQDMLFGVPEEDTTVTSDDISRFYRNYRNRI